MKLMSNKLGSQKGLLDQIKATYKKIGLAHGKVGVGNNKGREKGFQYFTNTQWFHTEIY